MRGNNLIVGTLYDYRKVIYYVITMAMERTSRSLEFENPHKITLEAPISEMVFDVEKIRKTWPEEYKNPQFIEQIESRKRSSKYISEVFNKLPSPTISIEQALEVGYINNHQAVDFYDSLSNILQDIDYQRLALYLPFEVLPNKLWIPSDDTLCKSIDGFEESYLGAWYNLLNIQDMRANFVDGDVLETEARPGDPPRVVKAAHLIPWLMSRGMINANEVSVLINDTDPILQRSVANTIPILDSIGLLSADEKENLYKIKASIPTEEDQLPLFISENRKKWLETRGLDNNIARPNKSTPIVNLPRLNGPFSDNLNKLAAEVDDISNKLSLISNIKGIYPVILLGGSQLKGYGDINSDVDVCVFVDSNISEYEKTAIDDKFLNYNLNKIEVENNNKLADPKERWVHELFNTAWIGGEKSITNIQHKLITDYFYEQNIDTRAKCIERLEQDLLQYRLMHKGYARHYPIYNERSPQDQEIDGQSVFYDSGYRQIATKLFIDKVFIPRISPI